MPSQYCEVVHHFSTGGESAFTDGKSSTDNDIVYDEDDPDDVDEDGCPLNDDTDSTGDTLTGMGMRPSTLAETMSAHLQNEAVASPDVLLRDAAMSSDVSSLKEVMRNVSDINAADESGLTALHFARWQIIMCRQYYIIKRPPDRFAGPDGSDKSGPIGRARRR